MTNKHMKRCSTLLFNREIKIKTMRYHLLCNRIATTKQTNKQTPQKISVDENLEILELLYNVGGNAKWCSLYRKWYVDFSKNLS